MSQVFPTWRYHKTEAPKLVHSEAELNLLGNGWVDSPAAFDGKVVEQSAALPVEAPIGLESVTAPVDSAKEYEKIRDEQMQRPQTNYKKRR